RWPRNPLVCPRHTPQAVRAPGAATAADSPPASCLWPASHQAVAHAVRCQDEQRNVGLRQLDSDPARDALDHVAAEGRYGPGAGTETAPEGLTDLGMRNHAPRGFGEDRQEFEFLRRERDGKHTPA